MMKSGRGRSGERVRATIVSRIYLPEPAAASFRLKALERGLVVDGAEVTVLTTEPAPGIRLRDRFPFPTKEKEAKRGDSVTVSRWPALRDKSGYVRGYLPYLSFDLPLFFRLLGGRRPDIAVVEPPPTTGAVVRVASVLRGFPYVWYAADVWSEAAAAAGSPKVITEVLGRVEKFAIRGAAGVLAVSQEMAQKAREMGAKNVCVVPGGIDTETYSPNAAALTAEELEEIGVTGPYLVYAGTASEWQGATVFAKAMQELVKEDSHAQVVFVGQGTEWEQIGQIAQEIREQAGRDVLVQLPMTEPRWVARLLAGAQGGLVSLIPDRGYGFAYPTKILAALATGKPVIYAGAGPAVADLEENRLGFVVPHSAEHVAEAMKKLLEGGRDHFDASSLRSWVLRKRSLEVNGFKAARYVLGLARPSGGLSHLTKASLGE